MIPKVRIGRINVSCLSSYQRPAILLLMIPDVRRPQGSVSHLPLLEGFFQRACFWLPAQSPTFHGLFAAPALTLA
jgi:hypothetical protein